MGLRLTCLNRYRGRGLKDYFPRSAKWLAKEQLEELTLSKEDKKI